MNHMNGNGIGAYQQAGVLTADPKRLVVMCYEEAIRNLNIAKDRLISRDYEEKAKALQKVHNIIFVLNSALDFENGGNIASNLHALYNYMTHSLLKADSKKDLSAMDHIIWMLAELKSAWEEILNGQRRDTNTRFRYITDQEKNTSKMQMRL
jgi:flagellar protein FliS